jgi:hypothetical protein
MRQPRALLQNKRVAHRHEEDVFYKTLNCFGFLDFVVRFENKSKVQRDVREKLLIGENVRVLRKESDQLAIEGPGIVGNPFGPVAKKRLKDPLEATRNAGILNGLGLWIVEEMEDEMKDRTANLRVIFGKKTPKTCVRRREDGRRILGRLTQPETWFEIADALPLIGQRPSSKKFNTARACVILNAVVVGVWGFAEIIEETPSFIFHGGRKFALEDELGEGVLRIGLEGGRELIFVLAGETGHGNGNDRDLKRYMGGDRAKNDRS